MATISTHTLNSVDGTHAGRINVTLYKIGPAFSREVVFETATDDGGRLSETISKDAVDTNAQYEMVLKTGDYFAAQSLPKPGMQVVQDVVIRFAMPDPEARYHIPLMLSPHSYSVWWSS